jgi:hypothetical protein
MSKTIDTELDNHDKIQAEIAKMLAETAKLNRENTYYPLIVGATITLAIVGLVKTFL